MEPSSRQRALRRLVLALDAALVLAAMALAFAAHDALRAVLPWLRDPPAFSQYALLVYLAMPLFVGTILAFGLHRSFERIASPARLTLELVRLHVGVLAGLAVLGYLTQAVINRSIVALFLAFTFVLLAAERALLARWQRWQYASGQGRQRVLLVGAPGEAMLRLVAAAEADPYAPAFLGYLAPAPAPAPGAALACLGGIERLEAVLREEAVDRVLFFPPYDRPAEVGAALAACDAVGAPAGFALGPGALAGVGPHLDAHWGLPFVTFERAPKPPEALALKHGLDVLAAALGLLVLSPLLLLIALAILVTMGRPILFLQERAGLHGRRFRMLKFRTMVRDAEERKAALLARNELSGPVFKLGDDPRITRLGRILRRTSLDELPQLFNVLAGQMSLVGPRPLPIAEQQGIRGWHRRRLSMKPGISGLWQVSGRSDVDFEGWMALDLEYVDRWSPALDLKILLKTLPAVLAGRGAK